jgi:hypothetical protein
LLPLEPGTLFSCELPYALIPVVRKTGLQSNKIKTNEKTKHRRTHNTRETHIYVVHPVWAISTREIARSFLYYYLTYEWDTTYNKPYNFLFFLSQSPLSEYNIHHQP